VSATARGAVSGYVREVDDFYRTPQNATRALLKAIDNWPQGSVLLDPGCGTGAILQAARTHGFPSHCLVGLEMHHDRAHESRRNGFEVSTCDALRFPWPDATVVVQNPPFSLAMEFIEWGLAWMADDRRREMAVLIRLNFMASAKRAAFWRKHPADLYVLSSRPSFCLSIKCVSGRPTRPGLNVPCVWHTTLDVDAERPNRCPGCDGKIRVTTSDATDYCWAVWGPHRGNRWSILETADA
jgi:hypothetical protein